MARLETHNRTEFETWTSNGAVMASAPGKAPGACSLHNDRHAIPAHLREALEDMDVVTGSAGCNGCALAAAEERTVFYVAQGCGAEERPRYLKYTAESADEQRRTAEHAVATLVAHGFDVEWDGDLGTALRLTYPDE
jgi:hypothetical protein